MSTSVDLASSREQIKVRLESLGLDYESTLLVYDTTRAANAIRVNLTNAVLRGHDLSWTGFAVLWLLWLHGPLETRHAAQAAAISKATLTGVVKTLEQRALLERIARQDDRRLVELHLTPDGAALIAEVFPAYNRAEAEALKALSPTQHKRLREGLEKLINSLESE